MNTQNQKTLTISKYTIPADADLCEGQYLVDLENPDSIATVLQHHLDDFEQFLADIADGGLDYGRWEDDDFESYFDDHLYSEEPFFEAAVNYPELHPLIAKYVERCIEETIGESTSGPWSTEETVLGEIAAYNLAKADPQNYKSLFVSLMEASVEVRCSNGVKQRFERYLDDIENDGKPMSSEEMEMALKELEELWETRQIDEETYNALKKAITESLQQSE